MLPAAAMSIPPSRDSRSHIRRSRQSECRPSYPRIGSAQQQAGVPKFAAEIEIHPSHVDSRKNAFPSRICTVRTENIENLTDAPS